MPESAAVLKKEPQAVDTASTQNWLHALELQCALTVEIPLPGFTVRDLSNLQPQAVIPSQWHVGEDVPLRINGQLIAWSEFEVARNQLAVRITELR
jgi:flagellar motor switch/type III secretory pathway protein FliN